ALERSQVRWRIARRQAAAIEKTDREKILIADGAPVHIASAGRFACHFPTAEVAGELARRAAAHTLDSKQRHHAPLDLQHPRGLHNWEAANDACARRQWDVACGGGGERGDARLRPNRLGPRRGALADEFVPDAR